MLCVYRADHSLHILVFEVDQVEDLSLSIDPGASGRVRSKLTNFCIRCLGLCEIMLQRDLILILCHGVKHRMTGLDSELLIRLKKLKPRKSLQHQYFLTDVCVSFKLLHVHIDKVYLPQLFLKLFIILVVLDVGLLFLLDLTF